MGALSLVRIHNDITTLLEITIRKGIYTVSRVKNFTTPHELSLYLASKTTVYLLFSTETILEEFITLPSVITNEATVQHAVLAKIYDNSKTAEKLILNKICTTVDSSLESATHRYEGVYESTLLSTIINIPKLEHLRRITLERYALFSIAEQALHGKNYLCAYTYEKRNLIIVVRSGVLLFSRMGEIQSSLPSEIILEQVNDIARTSAYAHQQYRDTKFECIAICGSVTDDEEVAQQLYTATRLNITTLAPTLMVKGLTAQEGQKHILEMGLLFLPPIMNFLPDRVKAAREFYLGNRISILFALFFMLFGISQSLSAYRHYEATLDEYREVQSTLFQTLQTTHTFDAKQLKEVTAQLESSTPLNHHIIDDLILFEPLLRLIKPQELTFTQGGELILHFSHPFSTLRELYVFEQNFHHTTLTLKTTDLNTTYQTDYNKLRFEAIVKIGKPLDPNGGGRMQ
ncbi:MAG: hypothetical protein WA080_05495 [Sulfuricurvum sp.]